MVTKIFTPDELKERYFHRGNFDKAFKSGIRSDNLDNSNKILKEAFDECETAYFQYMIALNKINKIYAYMESK